MANQITSKGAEPSFIYVRSFLEQSYTAASATITIGSVFLQRFKLFFGTVYLGDDDMSP